MGENQRRYYLRQKEARIRLQQLKREDPQKYQELMDRVNAGEAVVHAMENPDNPKYTPRSWTPPVQAEQPDWAEQMKADLEYIAKRFTGTKEQMEQALEELEDVFQEGINEARSTAYEAAVQAIRDTLPVEQILTVQSQNGEFKLQGHPHTSLPKLIQVANLRIHVFLVGPTGSGKTTAAHQAAEALGLQYFERAMGPNTSEWDLTGFRNVNGVYVPGILRQPYEEGGFLMLDEMDNTNPSVLTSLNSALANDHYQFPDKLVEQHKDFVCIAAGNTYGSGADRLYVGRTQLDAATLDRFVIINWDYDENAEKAWAGVDMIEWVQYVQRVRAITNYHKMRVIVSPRASIYGAKLLRDGMAREDVEQMTIWKGMSVDDKTKVQRGLHNEM